MNRQKAEQLINKLAQEANDFLDISAYNNSFEVWRDKVIRHLSVIFGSDSLQVKTLLEVKYPNPSPYPFEGLGSVNMLFIPNAIKRFEDTLKSFLDDLDLPSPAEKAPFKLSSHPQKIFISHSSDDKKLVSEIVHLLSLIGVQDSSIFCSSLEGYGIPLGDNWLETLKSEVSGEVIVLFVLSPNYFESEICLCEMGAAWVLSKRHIPILIPPFDFSDMQGVIPLTQGFKVDNKHRWTELKTELEGIFNLSPKAPQIWESRRDEILERIAKPSGSRSKFK